MKNMKRGMAAAGVAIAASLVISGCSTAAESPAEGPITLDYFGWVPSLEDAVAVWNEQNPDVQVNLIRTGGETETNPKIRSSVEAGNAPCISQMPLDKVASYVADDLLEPVTAEAAAVEDQFLPFTWSQVTLGGETYGIPQDTGPMVMFYRTDLYEQFDLTPATTWDEYADQARAVRAADPNRYLGFFGADDNLNWSGYAWQSGAEWFSVDSEGWTVGLDDAKTIRAAEYWQGLIDEGAIAAANRWDPALYTQLVDGTYMTFIGASWNASLIAANAADSSGLWAIAPMPTYADGNASANAGGSAVVVLKGCEHKQEAVDFATWLNSSEDSMNILASPDGGGLYPAAKAALEYDVVNQGVEFFGGQNIYEVFRQSAEGVNENWAWGPTYAQSATVIVDGFGRMVAGEITLDDVMREAQQATLDDMTTRGINAQPAS